MVWTAWLKVNSGDWQRVLMAPTERECWRRLLALPKAGQNVEMLCNTGKHPDHRRKPR
jgi:hypothetical protein